MIKKKYLSLLILGCLWLNVAFLSMVFFGSAQTPATDPDYILPINDRLISVNTFSIGNDINTVSGSIYKTPSGGDIRVEKSTPAINPSEIVDYPVITGIDADGNPIQIFRRTIPYEFDVNVWTTISTAQAAPTYRRATGTDTYVVAARIYDGDKLVLAQDAWTSAHKTDDVKSVSSPSVPWTYIPASTTASATGDGSLYFWTEKYTDWSVSVPFYIFNTQTQTKASSLYTIFNEQKDIIDTHIKNNVDIGNIDVQLDVQLDPLTGMPTSINTTNGQLLFKDAWVRFGGVSELSAYKETGYCASPTSAVTNFERVSGDDSQINNDVKDGTDQLGTNVNQVSGTAPSTDSPSNSYYTQSLSGNLYDTAQVLNVQTVVSSDFKTSNNEVKAFSTDLNMDYASAIQSSNKQGDLLNNKYSWKVQLNNFRLVPKVSLHKQSTTIHYYEYWINRQVGADEITNPHNNERYAIDTLLGWQVSNVYAHTRVRVNVDVYSQYSLNVVQSPSGWNNSFLATPTEGNGAFVWDMSPVGAQNFDYNWEDRNLEDWWNNLLDDIGSLFGDIDWTIILIVIGVIGLGVVIFYISKSGLFGSSAEREFKKFQKEQQKMQMEQLRFQQFQEQLKYQQFYSQYMQTRPNVTPSDQRNQPTGFGMNPPNI